MWTFGLVSAFIVLFYETLYGGAWFLIPLELALIGYLCIVVNYFWRTPLAKILSITLFVAVPMIMMIEIENMQHLFTKEFLLAVSLMMINIVVTVMLLEWIMGKKSILEHEVIEVTPIE